MSQLALDLAATGDLIDQHGLSVVVADRAFDPADHRSIRFMRRFLDEGDGLDARYVWVMSPHRGGQIRMYVLLDGCLRNVRPDYAGAWPELDLAVAARLDVPLFDDVAWGPSGPVERWREDA